MVDVPVSTVVKVDPDEDWYVVWSDIAEAPMAWGGRERVGMWLTSRGHWENPTGEPDGTPESRLARADQTGTSSLWPSPDDPHMGWQESKYPRGLIYRQQGWLPIDRMKALCERLSSDADADVRDLLDPLDGEDEVRHA